MGAREAVELAAQTEDVQQSVRTLSSELSSLRRQVAVRESAEECSSRPQFMRCRECNCMVDLALLEEHGLVCCTGEEGDGNKPLQV